MNRMYSLSDARPGERVRVLSLNVPGGIRRRLLDMGLTAGTVVECLGRSPGGDPAAFLIRGAVIALRRGNCENIRTAPLKEADKARGEGGAESWD